MWINENEYFKATRDPLFVKVYNMKPGSGTASVEVKYPDGKNGVYENAALGQKLFLNSGPRYFVLLEFKGNTDFGKDSKIYMSAGNKVRIAMYE